ncbi:5-oxoprolinase subunit PxpB [Alkalihalobacillus sp. 1P02AB]|uniref:5-oxoprolinase subunit PxpB n=1 Tax=Alkalihalobacillus sp. 1P02AB TaxID=3132260 RepID=UPI0039A6A0FD
MKDLDVQPLGDRAIRIGFGEEITLQTQQKVAVAAKVLEEANLDSVEHWIPGYTALTVLYDPLIQSYSQVKDLLVEHLKDVPKTTINHGRLITIPVCYGGNYGPDLTYVANYHQLTEREVIDLHSEPIYPIYMIGFSPGFPYLGGLNDQLQTPRLEQPREQVKAGSVGIGGKQTGVYPIQTPGGWQIIGRTPAPLFQKEKEHPSILEAGSFLKFIPIDDGEFRRLAHLVTENRFEWQIEHYQGKRDGEGFYC